MNLNIIDGVYSICKMNPSCSIPEWVYLSNFYSISRTADELSIVCEEKLVPEGTKTERNWGLIQVKGPLDFNLIGILASLTTPLAENKISIFVVSTFDTDYLLVRYENLNNTKAILEESGFNFE